MKTKMLCLALLLTCSPALADKIKNEFDKQAPFGSFKTYAFKPGLNTAGVDKERMDKLLIGSLQRELEARGMKQATDKPDVYVTYVLGIGGVEASGSLYAPGLGARYDYGIPPGLSSVSSAVALEGTLLIEMVNASTNHLAWRAICSGLVKHLNDPEKQEKRINEVVRKAFRSYPPKTGQ
jgi:Domain of unknown function (DUF4136)